MNEDRITYNRIQPNEENDSTLSACSLKGSVLTKFGDLLTIVGLPGTGKTSICEVIAAAALGSSCFGFEFNGKGKVLFIDTERPRSEVIRSYSNIKLRLNDTSEISLLHYIPCADYDSREIREVIEDNLVSTGFSTLIIDGILDLSKGINDEQDSKELVKWIRRLAMKHNLSVVVTLHPNKGGSRQSIAGHLGAFLYRWSRAILYTKKIGTVNVLTANAENSKLQYADTLVHPDVFYSYSQIAQMMIEVGQTGISDEEIKTKLDEVFLKELQHKEAELGIKISFGCGRAGARKMLKDFVLKGWLAKTLEGKKIWYGIPGEA